MTLLLTTAGGSLKILRLFLTTLEFVAAAKISGAGAPQRALSFFVMVLETLQNNI